MIGPYKCFWALDWTGTPIPTHRYMNVNICVYAYVCLHTYIFTHIWMLIVRSPHSHCLLAGGPADLIYVVQGGALIWPVAITLLDTVLHQWGQHNNDSAATLPHHLGTETQ